MIKISILKLSGIAFVKEHKFHIWLVTKHDSNQYHHSDNSQMYYSLSAIIDENPELLQDQNPSEIQISIFDEDNTMIVSSVAEWVMAALLYDN